MSGPQARGSREGGPREGADGRLVVAGVLVDNPDAPGRFLAARRTRPVGLAGLWELPGGKVEPTEAPAAALVRELAEELGVRARVTGALPGPLAHHAAPEGVWPLGRPGWVMAVLWVCAEDPARPLTDHDQLTWVGPDTVADLPWVPADRPIADAVAGILSANLNSGSAELRER